MSSFEYLQVYLSLSLLNLLCVSLSNLFKSESAKYVWDIKLALFGRLSKGGVERYLSLVWMRTLLEYTWGLGFLRKPYSMSLNIL